MWEKDVSMKISSSFPGATTMPNEFLLEICSLTTCLSISSSSNSLANVFEKHLFSFKSIRNISTLVKLHEGGCELFRNFQSFYREIKSLGRRFFAAFYWLGYRIIHFLAIFSIIRVKWAFLPLTNSALPSACEERKWKGIFEYKRAFLWCWECKGSTTGLVTLSSASRRHRSLQIESQ